MAIGINEKSEAIELIKEAQKIFDKYDLCFKQATGEQSLKKKVNSFDNRAKTLFPDVLFYEDEYQVQISIGWELKMPDTDINDLEFYENARDKAERMGLPLFVLWNFQSVYIYEKKKDSWFIIYRDSLENIKTRGDVKDFRREWKNLLESVILKLNGIKVENKYSPTTILSESKPILEYIAKEYSEGLADYYQKNLTRKELLQVSSWYNNELSEFEDISINIDEFEMLVLYSKYILLKWINRLVFCNLISPYQNTVNNAVNEFNNEKLELLEIAELFNEATKVSDYYTIINVDSLEKKLNQSSLNVLREYNSHLLNSNFKTINHYQFQEMLESIINISKREYMGLFTTPVPLANLLVKSTLNKQNETILDPCVGSGTITKTILEELVPRIGVDKAHNQVWASDKYSMPLQVANLSMSTQESIKLRNIIFQKDLLNLREGDEIVITNPQTGHLEKLTVPKFGYIFANFPFIRSERLDDKDRKNQKEVNEYLKSLNLSTLDMKRDWYEFGLVGIHRLLKDDGKAAIITSNSWMKTKKKGKKQINFLSTLLELYDVEKIIISNNKKWFQKADVVTTIIILNKNKIKLNTQFIKLESDILNVDEKTQNLVANQLLSDDVKSEHYTVESYSVEQIKHFISKGISLNILFNDIKWFEEVDSVLVPMTEIFIGKRGVKSTNDKFFYSDKFDLIEKEYIKPLLKTSARVDKFFATADSEIFVTRKTVDELKELNHHGALDYIESNKNIKRTTSQNKLDKWYICPQLVTGDFITSLNPDKRLFWSKVDGELVINQRLTVFKLKDSSINKELIHALLNCYLSQFMIESTGFGRGLGALDTTKDGIMDSLILDYCLLNDTQIELIIKSWHKLSQNVVPTVEEQLNSSEWNEFNELIFEAYGIKDKLNQVKKSLLGAINLRKVK